MTDGAWAADPCLTWADGRFYLYPTSDGFPNWGATAFRAYSSPDLAAWTDHGDVLSLGTDVSWTSGPGWAPSVLHDRGRHVMYFTAGGNCIGAAAALSPLGPFTDLGRPLVESDRWPGMAIDPSAFVDSDGQAYLLWGNGVLHIVPLDGDLVSFDPGRVVSHVPGDFREAGFLHRRGERYYLSWSEGDTRSADYQVCYATGPSPLGPWTEREPLLRKDVADGVLGTGHHSILQLPGTDRWVIAYHAFEPGSDGYHRAVRFDPLSYDDDGLLREATPADAFTVNQKDLNER